MSANLNRLALLAVSRQMYHETKLFPMVFNSWHFITINVMRRTATSLLPAQRLEHRSIAITAASLGETQRSVRDLRVDGYKSLQDLFPYVETVHLSTTLDDTKPKLLNKAILSRWRKATLDPLREWLAVGEKKINIVESVAWLEK
jgi:hypothetical protein